jgi:hypothetical protein
MWCLSKQSAPTSQDLNLPDRATKHKKNAYKHLRKNWAVCGGGGGEMCQVQTTSSNCRFSDHFVRQFLVPFPCVYPSLLRKRNSIPVTSGHARFVTKPLKWHTATDPLKKGYLRLQRHSAKWSSLGAAPIATTFSKYHLYMYIYHPKLTHFLSPRRAILCYKKKKKETQPNPI